MKKKYTATRQDRKDWIAFTKSMGRIRPKEYDIYTKNFPENIVRKLDLHGLSLIEANKEIKKFIMKSFDQCVRKVLVVTGKGLRSKSYNNPYYSEKLSILKYSVPEYLKNNENLNSKISRITKADVRDGGDGAMYIFLKKNFKE